MAPEFNPADEDEHAECRHEIERLTTEVAAVRNALSNCRMLAGRMQRKVGPNMEMIEAWGHIKRFAEEAGVKGSILRDEYTEGTVNPCPVSYPHMPHDYCDGKLNASGFKRPATPAFEPSPGGLPLEQNKRDWRIGLSCKPKMRTHERYYEPPGTIIDVQPSGTGGIFDDNGVLRIQQGNTTFLARAEDWITA